MRAVLNRILISLLLVCALSSCDALEGIFPSQSETTEFHWATIDWSIVKSEAYKALKSLRPIDEDMQTVRNKLRAAERKVQTIRDTYRQKCQKESDAAQGRSGEKFGEPGRIQLRGYHLSKSPNYDLCIDRYVQDDDLYRSLNEKKESLSVLSADLNEEDKRLKQDSEKLAKKLLLGYSEGRYVLVLERSRHNIVLNNSGVSLDITEGFLSWFSLQDLSIYAVD